MNNTKYPNKIRSGIFIYRINNVGMDKIQLTAKNNALDCKYNANPAVQQLTIFI